MLYVTSYCYRNYLREEFAKTTATSLGALPDSEDEEEYLHCMKENEEWNKQVALLREQRLIKVQEARRESILAKIVAAEEREKEQLEKVEQMVREEKVNDMLPVLKRDYKYPLEIGVEQPGGETDHSPPSGSEIKSGIVLN
jgi:small subunit ribosomal protein S26